ncbi:MAG: hypothetical protein IJ814_02625 [Paludibacteraceae bacterium]|nr:hypothetical protein [Paludibacteraceae bacterium]
MAEVKLNDAFEGISGKLMKKSDIYYRTRKGKQFAVQMVNPRNTYSEKEKVLHAGFGQIVKLTSRIAKDPKLAAPYMADFEAQKANGGQTSLYQYLLTRFLREAKSDREAKIAELLALCAS